MCIKIGRDASYFPRIKLIRPCKTLKEKQKRISGENWTFSFSQGLILVNFQLKFQQFRPSELAMSTKIGIDGKNKRGFQVKIGHFRFLRG